MPTEVFMYKTIVASAAIVLFGLPALAQTAQTGTGGGPESAARAPNVTTTGQTKPPSRDASPTANSDINRRTTNDANQDAVTKGICIGCEPK